MAKRRQAQRSAAYKRRRSAPRYREKGAPASEEPASVATPATSARPATPAKAAAPGALASKGVAKTPDFAAEYRYVLSDLQRLGILAVGSFVTLVILALIIR